MKEIDATFEQIFSSTNLSDLKIIKLGLIFKLLKLVIECWVGFVFYSLVIEM